MPILYFINNGENMNEFKFKSLVPNLMVESVNKTLDFYRDTLGFTVLMTVPKERNKDIFQWGMLQHGGALLMLQEQENLIDEYPELSQSKNASGLTLFIEVDDVENLYKKIKSTVTIIKELHVTFYGMKEFALQDINNVILVFAERVNTV